MRRGWKNNPFGLARWEVAFVHQTRLDATEAIAVLMRSGKSFTDAKKEIFSRARQIYKIWRTELYAAMLCTIEQIEFSDMPEDIKRDVEDWFLGTIEKRRGYKAGPLERLYYRWTGRVFSIDPREDRRA